LVKYLYNSIESVCFYSPVLKAAFEGGEHTYKLEDIRPNAFRLFVQWLCSGDFTTSNEDTLADKEITNKKAAKDFFTEF
jgi:hypothetical protein